MWHTEISPHRQAGSTIFLTALSFFLRGYRVPRKVCFTAKHLTVLGLFGVHLSKRRAEKKEKRFFHKIAPNYFLITNNLLREERAQRGSSASLLFHSFILYHIFSAGAAS